MNDKLPGSGSSNPIIYGRWEIYLDHNVPGDPNDWRVQWAYTHRDYDGPEDDRHGNTSSVEAAKAEIDAWEDEQLEDGCTECPRCGMSWGLLLHRFCQHKPCPARRARAAKAKRGEP